MINGIKIVFTGDIDNLKDFTKIVEYKNKFETLGKECGVEVFTDIQNNSESKGVINIYPLLLVTSLGIDEKVFHFHDRYLQEILQDNDSIELHTLE